MIIAAAARGLRLAGTLVGAGLGVLPRRFPHGAPRPPTIRWRTAGLVGEPPRRVTPRRISVGRSESAEPAAEGWG